MEHHLVKAVATLLLFGVTAVCAVADDADTGQKIIVALKTDDFELPATDISHLAVGDAETIRTDNGQRSS